MGRQSAAFRNGKCSGRLIGRRISAYRIDRRGVRRGSGKVNTARNGGATKSKRQHSQDGCATSKLGLHAFAGDLQIVTVGIFNMEAVLCIGTRGETALLQLGLYGILVPIIDGVGDVIDERRLDG